MEEEFCKQIKNYLSSELVKLKEDILLSIKNQTEQQIQKSITNQNENKQLQSHIQASNNKTNLSKQEKINIGKEAAECNNNTQTTLNFNIDEKTVRNYRSQYMEILTYQQVKKTKQKRNKKPKYLEMEIALLQWLNEQRQKCIAINYKQITEKAKELCKDENFSASSGWFSPFQQRYKITHRTPTHKMQKCSEIIKLDVENFLEEDEVIRFIKRGKNKILRNEQYYGNRRRIMFNVIDQPIIKQVEQ